MKKPITSVILCLVVLIFVLLSLSNGTNQRSSGDIPDNASADTPPVNADLLSKNAGIYNDFSLRLLTAVHSEESLLLSPLSTVYGLAMTANGAGGEALAQLENAIGMSQPDMNEYFYSYVNRLDRTNDRLQFASSAWLAENERFTIEKDFLRTCATWYDAEIHKTTFDHRGQADMDAWISENTGGAMDCPAVEFHQDTGIILLNTMLFDGHWETPFYENSNTTGSFTREDETEDTVTYMHSREDLYFENDVCSGFLKPYWTESYIFAAILPEEGLTIAEFLSSMDGQSLSSLLSSAAPADVHVTMPKFTAAYEADIIPALQSLGITDVFDTYRANLEGIGGDHLYITDIRSDTTITVDEIGTRAVAVSMVAEFPASAREPLEEKWVELDRPFVYMILEQNTMTPIFLGTMMTGT